LASSSRRSASWRSPKLITGAIDPALGFVFVNILAVVVETFFFVGALFPSIEMFIISKGKSTIIATAAAIIIVSLVFASVHIVATNGGVAELTGLFEFCALMCISTKLTKNLGLALGEHFGLNIINGG